MPNRERYVIEIADAGSKGDPPAAVRLRRLLKSALRGYGFRATRCAPAAADSEEAPEKTDTTERTEPPPPNRAVSAVVHSLDDAIRHRPQSKSKGN